MAFTAKGATNRQGQVNEGAAVRPTGVKAMSIRFPHELAAAVEYAERAVETVSQAPSHHLVPTGDATFDLGLSGEPIRLSLGPGFIPAGAPRKLIPGQTYH
jgi:hypothetical protein